MSKREPISKKTRFEVFKRDKFTCQYCGGKAPEVVLHVDHIHPVAEGGKSDVLNLITACAACNGGKGARKLDDQSAVQKQRRQIEELEERREQLEMMLAWRDAAVQAVTDEVDVISDRLTARGHFTPNESGRSHIRRWLKRFSLAELLTATDEALDVYLRYKENDATSESWELAFKKIPGVANMQRLAKDRSYLPKLFYIQGILRRRFEDRYFSCVEELEDEILHRGATIEMMERIAKRADTWNGFLMALDVELQEAENALIDMYLGAVSSLEGGGSE